MVLHIHSDASYLSEPKARSRLGGHFYLSLKPSNPTAQPLSTDPLPPNNGPIHTNSTIMKPVLSSAAEAKLGGLFFNMCDAVPIRSALEELGHPQPPTRIVVNNSTAAGITNKTVKQRRSKAVDMRFYWVQDRIKQKQFQVYWREGAQNLADCFTKHHPARYHVLMRSVYLHPKRLICHSSVNFLSSYFVTQCQRRLRGCVNLFPGPVHGPGTDPISDVILAQSLYV